MKKIWLFLVVLSLFLSVSSSIFAADDTTIDYQDGCTRVGQCMSNKTCILERDNEGNRIVRASDAAACGSSSIGGVTPPGAVAVMNGVVGNQNGGSIGIIYFISNLLRLFAIIAGIWSMFNLIMAGYTYIASMSDAGATQKVANNITMTVIGLAIIAGGYIIAAIVGALMFGDPNFILQPELQGALQ